MDNDHLKNQFDFDFNGHTNVFVHCNLIAIVIFLVGITDWLTLYIHTDMQALTFSHMYIQGATAQFGTASSHKPAKSTARWFMCRRGIMSPRLSRFSTKAYVYAV